MNTISIPVREALGRQAQEAAAQQGESLPALVEAFLEEYLEELEDIAVAQERLARVARGESVPIPWEDIREEFLSGDLK